MELEITTLIENNPDNDNKLIQEHGLSLYIEAYGVRILFDTGKSGDFIQNASQLHKDLHSLDYMVISHGHYDHSSGLVRLIETVAPLPKLFVGNEFFKPKYKKCGVDGYHYNGNPFNEEYIQAKNNVIKKISEDKYNLTEKIMIFHNFQRTTDYEKLNEKFVVQQGDSFVLDDFLDEIALGIITQKGLVVVVGCSHVGLINILQSIAKQVELPIYAVVGGTHLIDADATRLSKTAAALQEMNIKLIAVSHCTGEDGIQYIKKEFSERFIYNNTGNVIQI